MVCHHAIGIGEVGNPAFPDVGKWSGTYHAVNDFKIAEEHPVTSGFKIGDQFKDSCWDYDQVEPGMDGIVIVKGLKQGIPTPAVVVGKVGKGHVIVSGIGIGAGYKKTNGKWVKYEADIEGGLKTLLLNSVKWMLNQ